MTPLTPETVQQLAQTAATSPAHLDPQVVQQVCQEWAALHKAAVARTEQAERERDEARAALDGWVKWASSSRCIYCGQEFVHDPHDQEGADEPKKAHILTCAKHPMAQAQAALTEARRVLRESQTFIEYARHELQPTLKEFAQFPSQACADTMLAKIAAVLAQEEK